MNIKVNTADELIQLAERYDAVSFDLFDTLLTRRCLTPEDVFAMTGQYAEKTYGIKGFADFRKKAILENEVPNPNLKEIYDKLKRMVQEQNGENDITEEAIHDLMQHELQIEKNVLVRRESVVDTLRKIRKQGKKIYLLTDMYLDHTILEGILADLGIHEHDDYDEMLISCECRTLKTENLFGIYRENHPANSYLHIGDNKISDIASAAGYGIDTVEVDSPVDMYNQFPYQYSVPLSGNYSLTERNLLGAFISIRFNNPFPKESAEKSSRLYAEEAYGTLLAYLMLADIRKITQMESFDKILFSSRDGWLLHRIYEKTRTESETESIYFYTSRKAANGLAFPDDQSILWLAHLGFSCPQSGILKEAFDVDVNDQPKGQEFDQWILSHKEQILERAAEKKKNYQTYLRKNQLENGRYFFFDLISTGTCQLRLNQVFGLNLTGYYLYKQKTSEPEREALPAYSFYKTTDTEAENSFIQLHYLFELIFSSPEPSLDAFNHLGEPLFKNDARTLSEITTLSMVQDRICENVTALFGLSDYSNENQMETSNKEDENPHTPGQRLLTDLLGAFIQYDLPGTGLTNAVLNDDWMNTKHMAGEELKGQDFFSYYHYAPIREGLLSWMDFRPEAKVLELGCESGALTGLFLRNGCHVTAADAEENNIETLKVRYSHQIAEEKLETVCCSWFELNENINTKEKDDLFDYIILMPSFYREHLEDCLKAVKCFLKEDGVLFIAAQNRIGTKAITEDRPHGIPGWDISLTKRDLEHNLSQAGIEHFRFYYPLPDFLFPQEICSEEFLPEAGRTDRVLDYHPDPRFLILDPDTLKRDFAENGVSEAHMNSFLVICSKTESEEYQKICSIRDIHLSTDRTKERAFATRLYTDRAEKKALYPEGSKGLSDLMKNTQELSVRSIRVLPLTEKECGKDTGNHSDTKPVEGTLVMPFCKAPLLIDVLKEHAADNTFLEEIFHQLWRNILLSSEDAISSNGYAADSLHILKKAYIEMIPLNCFYDEEGLLYFDQEFSMTDCPAEYVMFRALRYTDLEFANAGLQFPLNRFIEEYGLTDYWETGLKREDEFIYNLRNYRLYESFHKWSKLDRQMIARNRQYLRERSAGTGLTDRENTELRADNPFTVESEPAGNDLILSFSKAFYPREEDGAGSHFRWSKVPDAVLEISNSGGEKIYGIITFTLISADGKQTNAEIWTDGTAEKTVDLTAGSVEIPICVFPSERIRIQIKTKCNPVHFPGDTRELSFGLWNYRIETINKERPAPIIPEAGMDEPNSDDSGTTLPSFKNHLPEPMPQGIDLQFSDDFYPIEEDEQGNKWHWAGKQNASIAVHNHDNQAFRGELSFFLSPRVSDTSSKMMIEEFCEDCSAVDSGASKERVGSRSVWIPNRIRIPLFLQPEERKKIKLNIVSSKQNGILKHQDCEGGTDTRDLFFQVWDYGIRKLKIAETDKKNTRRIQLEMLKLLVCVCEEYNLRYFAMYGTLLGAVRDGGYVPGDDDIDLALPREDYDRLRELICHNHVLPEQYEWIDPVTCQSVFHGGYAKLTDTSNRIKKLESSDRNPITEKTGGESRHDFSKGIYIDLFPLDYCEEDEESRTAHFRQIEKLQKILRYKATDHLMDCKADEEHDIRNCAESVTWNDAVRQLDEQFRKTKKDNSNFLAILARQIDLRETKIWDWRYFGDYETRPFEDTEIRIPIGYAELLQQIYGSDYMEYLDNMME